MQLLILLITVAGGNATAGTVARVTAAFTADVTATTVTEAS